MLRLLIATIALISSSALADTLIVNANGIQIGSDGKIDRFHSMHIADDGKVVFLSRGDQLPTWHGRVRIDAKGKTILPGLIDAHGHVMGLGLGALQLDLVGTNSLSDLQQRLRAYAAGREAGWIVGRGWNQELWPDRTFPTAADLDAVISDRPVVLERVDGHAAVANSAALKAGGITSATQDPSGGKIERGPDGRPTGLLIDAATELVSKKVPTPSQDQRDRGLAEAQRLMLSNGLTAAADMGTSAEDWATMRRAGRAGRLKVRILSYALGTKALGQVPELKRWLHGDRLRMAGVKIYSDGALGSRGAWLKRPYADAPTMRGLRFLSDAELQQDLDLAAARGVQPAVHAIGDAANEQAIAAFERLSRRHPGDRRWRIEHAQVIDPSDIPRLAPAGIIASMQPTHQTSDRTMAEKRLDPPRLEGAYAWQTIARSGARLVLGSDFPVESSNPFPGLSAAISRQDPQGQPPGGWRSEERLTFAQALAGFTRDAAYAAFAEDRIGSLESGTWADFILVDRDPTVVDPRELAATKVLETWIAGERVWAATEEPAISGGERGR